MREYIKNDTNPQWQWTDDDKKRMAQWEGLIRGQPSYCALAEMADCGELIDEFVVAVSWLHAALREIDQLRDIAIRADLWHTAPCPLCGYNGEGYYQPSNHECAKRAKEIAGENNEH